MSDVIAEPGDPDLDIDVDGLTMTSVIVEGREVLFRATGGFGAWIASDGHLATFRPGHDNEGVEHLEGRMLLDSTPQDIFDRFVTRLQDWRDRQVPLRLCGAPDRPFSLIEDRSTWVPLPRRSHPSWTE